MSPNTINQSSFYVAVQDKFKATIPVGNDALAHMRAIAVSAGEDGSEAELFYAAALEEMYGAVEYYSKKFDLTVADFPSENAYYAQIQAFANARGFVIQVFDLEEYDGGSTLPYREYNPKEIGPTGYLFITKDGDNHCALHAIPQDDPEDSSGFSEESSANSSVPSLVPPSEEKKPPTSIEKLTSYFGFGSNQKKVRSSTAKDTPPSRIFTTPKKSSERRSKRSQDSATKKLENMFEDTATSTAQTVQTGSAAAKKSKTAGTKKKKKKSLQVASPPALRKRKGGISYKT